MKKPVWGSLFVVAVACSGTSGGVVDVAKMCNTYCTKLETCDKLGPLTVAQCEESCDIPESSSCEVSAAQAQTCIDAVGAAECDALGSPLPECQPCEEEDTTETDDTTDTEETDDTTETNETDDASGGACADLAECCALVDAEHTAACEAVVALGNGVSCSGALTAYRLDEQCP